MSRTLIVTEKFNNNSSKICNDILSEYCNKKNIDLRIIENVNDMNFEGYESLIYISNKVLIMNQDYDIQDLFYDSLNEDVYLLMIYDLRLYDCFKLKNTVENKDIINYFKYSINKNIKKFYDDIYDKKIKKIINVKFYNHSSNIMNYDSCYTNISNCIFNNFFMEKFIKNFIFYTSLVNVPDFIVAQFQENLLSYIKFKKLKYEYLNDYDKFDYKGDFEVFNPGKKIAFITLYTDNIKDEGKEIEFNMKTYCLKNDYTFYIYRKSPLENLRHPTYSKPYLLKSHFIDPHENIIWIDSDMLILDQNFKIETLIEQNFCDLLVYKDINYYLNAGFLIFKNNEISKKLIQDWIYLIEKYNAILFCGPTRGDQGILIELVKDKYKCNTIILPNININDSINNYYINNIKIIHFMNVYGVMRHFLMLIFNQITFNKK